MNKSSGNVLFLILIAVALFAALSYAVTQSTRSGGGDASKEKMQLAFDEMQNVVIAHRTAIQRMIISGIDPSQVSVSDSPWSFPNTDCTTASCEVYNPQGGGVTFYRFHTLHPALTPSSDDYNASGVVLAWVAYQGTQMADFTYHFWVTENFCNFINQKIGLNTPTTSMGAASMIGTFTPQTGTYTGLGTIPDAAALGVGHAPYLFGRSEGCYKKDNGGDRYEYYSMLQTN